MNHSEQLDQLAAALATAQAAFVAPKRTRTVKTEKFSYTYSTLDDLIGMLRAPLAAAGLSFMQTVETSHETGSGIMVGVETTILHATGQWASCGMVRMPAGNTAQQYGSALTYGRRYSLQAAFGIVAEDDDDAGSVPAQTQRHSPRPAAPPPPAAPTVHAPRPVEHAEAPVVDDVPDLGPDPLFGVGDEPESRLQLPAAPNSPPISEPQRKRLYAICRGKGLSNDQYRVWINDVAGYESDNDIRRAHYDIISKAAEAIG